MSFECVEKLLRNMSYSVNTSDVEDKNLSDFRHNRSSSNLVAKNLGASKIADVLWAKQQQRQHNDDDTDSEISDSGNFLAKGILEAQRSENLVNANSV